MYVASTGNPKISKNALGQFISNRRPKHVITSINLFVMIMITVMLLLLLLMMIMMVIIMTVMKRFCGMAEQRKT